MKKVYDVFFGVGRERDYQTFTTKRQAEKFGNKLLEKGIKNVFIDVYDNEEDMNLIHSIKLA